MHYLQLEEIKGGFICIKLVCQISDFIYFIGDIIGPFQKKKRFIKIIFGTSTSNVIVKTFLNTAITFFLNLQA